MKIGIVSDVHSEFWNRHKVSLLANPVPEPWRGRRYDVLIMAGDIGYSHDIKEIVTSARYAADHIVYVAGNHEHYGKELSASIDLLRSTLSKIDGVHFLEKESVMIDGIRFLGCTLWTDYRVMESAGFSKEVAMEECQACLADHRHIRVGAERFTTAHALAEHESAVAWLRQELPESETKTVVVTHHAPLARSIHQKYTSDLATAGFASDLKDVVDDPVVLWAHGHMHDPAKYPVKSKSGNDIAVVLNPRGYPNENYPAFPKDDSEVYKPFEIDV